MANGHVQEMKLLTPRTTRNSVIYEALPDLEENRFVEICYKMIQLHAKTRFKFFCGRITYNVVIKDFI